MTRDSKAGALYGDFLPSGAWAVIIPNQHCETHLGLVPFPTGETFGPLFLRCTDVNGFRFAGQAHDTANPACWERDGAVWVPYAPPCIGVSPVIYDLDGVLHRSDGSVGSQGYRYVNPQNQIISGDATYGPFHGLSEYTYLEDGLWVGQGHDIGGALVWDGTVLRLLEAGDSRFIRANRDGEMVTLAITKTDGVTLLRTTMAELRALPPIPERQPGPINHTHEASMEIDGKTVILRGPAGKLAAPDAPNTGPWASLGTGWRGMAWASALDSANPSWHHRVAKLPNGRYTFTSHVHGLAGADATKHSGSILEQFYYKPDGNTDAGGYEQWRVYDGNENGAIEAQIEYDNDEGKYFACPLAVEVVE